jgi:hypothetical protein
MKINLNYKIIYYIKLLIFSYIIINILQYKLYIENESFNLNYYYSDLQKQSNLTFKNKIKAKIKIGIFTVGLKNGGRARITSQLIKYLTKIKIFEIYLFTQKIKEENEYINQEICKRILRFFNL